MPDVLMIDLEGCQKSLGTNKVSQYRFDAPSFINIPWHLLYHRVLLQAESDHNFGFLLDYLAMFCHDLPQALEVKVGKG